MSKRFLSLLMALVFCFSMLPTEVLAETADAATDETQNVEDTVDVPSVGEDAVVQSGEEGGVAVQAGEHTDHALCLHTSTCSCPEDAKSDAFTDAKALTCKTKSTEDGELYYLYIGEGKDEAEVDYNLGFRFFILPEGNYYLAENVTLPYAIQIPKNAKVNLCLNGYSITKTTATSSPGFEGVITIDSGAIFSLCDCKNSGKITHESGKFGRGVKGGNLGVATFNMYGGEISGNNAGISDDGQDGAGVYMQNGTFTMYGGKITDNHVNKQLNCGGGGVYVYSGTFTMSGGEISGNTSSKYGGGVFMQSGTFTMSGGTVSGNNADQNGGGVAGFNGTLELSGDAIITDNTATDNGGGVYYYNYSAGSSRSVTVSGSAKIEKNKAANGGGIYVDEKGKLTMTGGTVTENKAENGGGVWTANAFTVSGAPKIIDNTDSTGNTTNNVYPGTASITIGQDGMDASANIGVTTGHEDSIESGKYVTVGTGANNGYHEGNIFSDKGGDYVIKADGDNINLYNGLPHEHPVSDGENVTWKPIGSEDALRAITNVTASTCCYYLKDNITLHNTTWTPPDGMVLDLNGKNITMATDAVDTITIGENVNFTLTDCKGGGEYYGSIMHDMKSRLEKYLGRGVTVLDGGRFTMYGGAVAGNQANYADGAGVYVSSGAYFTMLGGEIAGNMVPSSMKFKGGGIWTAGDTTIGGNAKVTGNYARLEGGGVYVDNGTLTLADNAKVTGNTSNNYRNGIFVGAGGRLCVSGSVQVTGNLHTNNLGYNVYLQENGSSVNPIIVVGALTGARIDVSVPDDVLKSINDDHFVTIATADTEGWIQDSSFIGENDAAHNVIVSDNGKLARLGTHLHDWVYTASSDGLSITAACSNENCTSDGGSVTIVPPDESSLTYNGDPKAATLKGELKTGVKPEITYKMKEFKAGAQYAEMPVGSVPINAAYYKAIITVGNVTAEAPYTIAQATPTANDFIVTLPTDPVYDGNGKIATVKVRDGVVGMGDYDVMYFYYPKTPYGWTYADPPIDVGTYVVRIRVDGTGNYAYTPERLLDEDNWMFTINPADYTVNVPESWTDAEKPIEVIEGSIFNTAIVAITQNYAVTVTATGVNDEKIVGSIDWYTDEACTQPVDRTKMINKTAGTTVKLYWKFAFLDDSQKKNFGITKDETGSVDVIIKEGEKQDLSFSDASGKKTTGSTAKYGGYPIRIRVWNDTVNGGKVTCENSEPNVATIDVDDEGYATVTICGVGTTIITATADMVPGLYAKTTATYTLTVEKGVWGENVTVAMQSYVYGSTPKVPSLFYYKGDDNDVTYYYGTTEDINSGEWTEWNLDNPPKLDAGDYYIHAKIKESALYEAHTTTTASPFYVYKAFPAWKAPEGVTARYGQKLSDIQLVNPEGTTPGTWSWMNGEESVGDVSATAKLFKARFTPDDTKNYEICENIDIEVTVKKAAAPTVTDGSLTVTNEVADTYSFDLASLLPQLDYGTITYGTPTFTGADGYYNGDATVENGKLRLPILANAVTQEGKIGEVKVSVTTDRYETVTLTVNIYAKNRLIPTLDGDVTLSPAAITYGEKLGTITISGTMKAGDATIDGTFTWQNPDTVLDAGTHWNTAWKFTPNETKLYKETSGTAAVTVNKAKQSGKLNMTGYTYKDTPSVPTLSERTGDTAAQVTYEYFATAGGTVQIWDISQPPELTAGTYYMRAVIAGTNNYDSFTTADVEFTVAKATPNYKKPAGLTAKYGQTLGDIALTNPEGTTPGTWSWQAPQTALDKIGSYTYDADFKPDDPSYKGVVGAAITVTIGKADGGNLKTEELTQKYTDASEHVYTPDWSALPAGQTWSYSSEYSAGSDSAAKLDKQDVAAENGKLTYAISGGKAGDKITVTLKATCANYEDYTVTLNITLADRDEQAALIIIGDTAVTYGQTLQLGSYGGSGTGTVTYTVTNVTGEATVDSDTGVLTPVKVGTVSVVAAKAGDNDYKDVFSDPLVITVTQAATVGEPKHTPITARGKTLNDAALTADGSTLEPKDGTLEWVDDDGNVLPNDTKIEANKTYKWRFTPADSNYTVLTGEIELYHASSGGGGGSTRYTVSFDTNGGSKLSKQTVSKNSAIKEPAAPEKEGYDFAGWYTDKELKEKYDFSAKVTKNITLYAAWTEKDNSANQIILTIGEKDALVFGTKKTNDVAPKIVNDRTMLPARFVAENLGADVSWDEDKRLVTICGKNLKTGEDITIRIYIGSAVAYVNDKEINLDSAAFIENDRTYTPVRFISEELGASVEWIESEQKVVITK